jgi:rRNA biogenesis protein RRP5
VRTRITALDIEASRITASIRQGAPNYVPPVKVTDIELGSTSSATVVEVQRDNIVVTLSPSNVRALLSINNLANKRGIPSSQLRSELNVGDSLSDLIIVSRNPEKNFVIVSAGAGKAKESSTSRSDAVVTDVDIKTLKVGDIVSGRVVSQHGRQGSIIRVTKSIVGHLHPVDTSDDFSQTPPFPALNSVVRAAVLDIDQDQKRLVLSTRPSRLSEQSEAKIIDPEITSREALTPGMRVRGFIKSVIDHGLFVSIGRGIDARVQIRELFDEVKDICFCILLVWLMMDAVIQPVIP